MVRLSLGAALSMLPVDQEDCRLIDLCDLALEARWRCRVREDSHCRRVEASPENRLEAIAVGDAIADGLAAGPFGDDGSKAFGMGCGVDEHLPADGQPDGADSHRVHVRATTQIGH